MIGFLFSPLGKYVAMAGLAEALSPGGPQALSDAVVLVPSRRAARGLAEAFVEVGGGRALLTPVEAASIKLAGIMSSTGVSSGFSRAQKNAGPTNKITSSNR